MSKKEVLESKVEVLQALAHPIRLQIVERLGKGEMCVSECLEMFDIDISALSRHLSRLKRTGILIDKKRGKYVYYYLKHPSILPFLSELKKINRRGKKLPRLAGRKPLSKLD